LGFGKIMPTRWTKSLKTPCGTASNTGDLDRIGQPIGLADPIIAAIAIGQGLELVTGNTAHYQRIQQLNNNTELFSI
jgi:predicted nucleic acid-binding protein